MIRLMNLARRQRSAYTLMEMLVVISIVTLLVAINAKWIHASLNFSSRVKQRHRQQLNLKRLGTNFSRDVRRCQKMLVEDRSLRLNSANFQASYTIEDDQILLTRKREGKTIFRDRFELGSHVDADWDETEMPNWITLVIRRKQLNHGEAGGSVEFFVRTGPRPWEAP